MKVRLVALSVALVSSVGAFAETAPEAKVKVLIVDGFSNHDWKATTKAITSILSSDDDFEIEVSTVPAADTGAWKQWNPTFKDYDVVVQNTNDISKKGSWPEPAKRSLEKYVSDGGGLLVFHSANNAFPK